MRIGRNKIKGIGFVVGTLNVIGSLASPSSGTERDRAIGALFTLGLIVFVASAILSKWPRAAQWLYATTAVLGLIGPFASGDYSLLLWPAIYGTLSWLTFQSRKSATPTGG